MLMVNVVGPVFLAGGQSTWPLLVRPSLSLTINSTRLHGRKECLRHSLGEIAPSPSSTYNCPTEPCLVSDVKLVAWHLHALAYSSMSMVMVMYAYYTITGVAHLHSPLLLCLQNVSSSRLPAHVTRVLRALFFRSRRVNFLRSQPCRRWSEVNNTIMRRLWTHVTLQSSMIRDWALSSIRILAAEHYSFFRSLAPPQMATKIQPNPTIPGLYGALDELPCTNSRRQSSQRHVPARNDNAGVVGPLNQASNK